MRFGKNHKVVVSTLNEEEARAFVDFLVCERERHEADIEFAQQKIGAIRKALGLWTIPPMERAVARIKFWESAIARHRGDIEGIDKLLLRINKRFGWE